MKGRHQNIRPPFLVFDLSFHGARQSFDVIGVVMPLCAGAQCRLPAQLFQAVENRVMHRGGCGGAVLGVKRHHHYALAAGGSQCLKPAVNGWLPVAHGPIDLNRVTKFCLQTLSLLSGVSAQRTFIGLTVPDLGIGMG